MPGFDAFTKQTKKDSRRAGSPTRQERMEERRAMYAKEASGSKTPRATDPAWMRKHYDEQESCASEAAAGQNPEEKRCDEEARKLAVEKRRAEEALNAAAEEAERKLAAVSLGSAGAPRTKEQIEADMEHATCARRRAKSPSRNERMDARRAMYAKEESPAAKPKVEFVAPTDTATQRRIRQQREESENCASLDADAEQAEAEQDTPKRAGSPSREERMEARRAIYAKEESPAAKPKAVSATTPQQEETKTNVEVEQATPKGAGSPSREERMEERRAMYAKEAGGSKTPRTKAQIKADAEQNAARGLKTPRTITQEAQTDQALEATPQPAWMRKHYSPNADAEQQAEANTDAEVEQETEAPKLASSPSREERMEARRAIYAKEESPAAKAVVPKLARVPATASSKISPRTLAREVAEEIDEFHFTIRCQHLALYFVVECCVCPGLRPLHPSAQQ